MAQTIMLSSQILHDQEYVAKPQQLLVFTCVTVQSGILEWRSDEYIGQGIAIQLLSINCIGHNFSSGNNLAIGTCINVTNDGGAEVIVSELYVVASLQHPTATVTCRNNGVGTSMQIRFNTTGEYSVHVYIHVYISSTYHHSVPSALDGNHESIA